MEPGFHGVRTPWAQWVVESARRGSGVSWRSRRTPAGTLRGVSGTPREAIAQYRSADGCFGHASCRNIFIATGIGCLVSRPGPGPGSSPSRWPAPPRSQLIPATGEPDEHDGAVPPRRQPVRHERGADDPRAGGPDVPGDLGGGGVVGAARAAAGSQERGREAPVPARGRRGAVPQRHEVEDTMTGVPESAFAGEGQEAGPAEPPERRCARCGAVGTHYLTCPGLR